MRRELEKYGIQMPAFSKIGGILANEVQCTPVPPHKKKPNVDTNLMKKTD